MTTIETFEQAPLLAQDSSPLIKTHEQRGSLWTTQQRKMRRVIIPPHHLMQWIHDNRPTEAIPADAQFHALGLDAANNWIGFEYSSLICPESRAFYLRITDLLQILKEILRDKLPGDSSVTGIFLSSIWALVMIEVSSHRFPDLPAETQPVIQVRYEGKQLIISDQTKTQERFTKESV